MGLCSVTRLQTHASIPKTISIQGKPSIFLLATPPFSPFLTFLKVLRGAFGPLLFIQNKGAPVDRRCSERAMLRGTMRVLIPTLLPIVAADAPQLSSS